MTILEYIRLPAIEASKEGPKSRHPKENIHLDIALVTTTIPLLIYNLKLLQPVLTEPMFP